ncbi:hypothetical protein AB0L40_23370 [Patulibacter sp. NPDC049589]|uniref:hypothetical protein n=1 Tax=Patulibacter sp. NPDC049589 TaxID=3154731 RepID=UPI003449BB72
MPFVPVLAAAGLLALPGGASAVSAPTIPAGASKVSRGVCTTSATDPQARAASFTVRMRDVPPTSSYGFAVRLEERLPGGRWKALKGAAVPAGFGDFVTARSGAPSLSRRFNVQGLHAGSSYRLRATYKWMAFGGYRATERVSKACKVKDLRPDVGLTGEFGWQPSTAGGEVAYRIGLASDGLDALKGVDVPVVVRQGQTVLATGSVRPAAAGEVLLVPGRRCVQGQPVTVQLDPDGLVDDRVATDDVLSAPCAPVSR